MPPLPKMNTPADLEPNAPCRDGAALLMKYKVDHIAFVTSLTDTHICIREANYKPNQETFRCLPLDDKAIRGCYFPN